MKRLGISRATMFKWIKDKTVKSIKRGYWRFVPIKEVERLEDGR
jgi:predicted DNA-binding transcriptional regulator AlpA